MPKVGVISVDFVASTSRLRANLAEASSLIRDWSLLSTGLGAGITTAFKNITDIGIKALQLGMVGLIGTFTLAARSGSEFEDSMVRTFTVLSESSVGAERSFSALTQQARLLGRDTLFSATQAAQGMEILAKAGFNAREIMNSIRPALNLAIVGNIQLAESSSLVISALKGFNLESKEAGRVSDVLALGASKANTTIELLGSALSYVAPVAAGTGLSLEETAAAIGVLSNAGIRGSRAGTTLRRAISQMISPTATAEGIFKSLGVTMTTTDGNLRSLTEIVRDLNEAGITTAQTMKAFGLRAGPGMVALLKQGSAALGSLRSDLESADGAADRMAQNFRTTVKGRLRDLGASVVDLGLAFSEEFKKPLADSIFAVRNFLVSVVSTGEKLGLFEAIVKGIGKALSPIIELISELSNRFLKLFANLTPTQISQFFENIRLSIQGLIQELRGGDLGAILSNTFKIMAISGKSAIGTLMIMRSIWRSLPRPVRELIGPIAIVGTAILTLIGGVTKLVIFFIAMRAILMSMPVAMIAFTKTVAVLGTILKFILGFSLVIAAGFAAWKLGGFIAELRVVRIIFAFLAQTMFILADSLRLVGRLMKAAFTGEFILNSKALFKETKAGLEQIENRFKSLKEIPGVVAAQMGVANQERANEKTSSPLEQLKVGMGGQLVDVASFFGTDFQELVKGSEGNLEKAADTTQKIAQDINMAFGNLLKSTEANADSIEELERQVAALLVQARKPDVDRRNKSKTGATFE